MLVSSWRERKKVAAHGDGGDNCFKGMVPKHGPTAWTVLSWGIAKATIRIAAGGIGLLGRLGTHCSFAGTLYTGAVSGAIFFSQEQYFFSQQGGCFENSSDSSGWF